MSDSEGSDYSDDSTSEKRREANKPFNDIVKLYAQHKEFCTGGTIDMTQITSKLFFKSSASDGTAEAQECVDFWKLSSDDIEKLIKNSHESPFGKGNQTLVDHNVRKATEIREGDFAFQFSPSMDQDIVLAVKEMLGGRDFVILPYKVNIYGIGGHFLTHKDTLRDKNMIASLVLCLPSKFGGGDLTVSNENKLSVKFNGAEKNAEGKLNWACFFCDCDHEISEVTDGTRITVTYNVHTISPKTDTTEDTTRSTVKKEMSQGIHDLCVEKMTPFMNGLDQDKNIKYGYYMQHLYGFSIVDEDVTNLKNLLKGVDLSVYNALIATGWNVQLNVVYPDLDPARYGPRVKFDTPWDAEVDMENEDGIDMESTISAADMKLLRPVKDLNCINKMRSSQRGEIHRYFFFFGWKGNSANDGVGNYYAWIVMVFSKGDLKRQEKEKPKASGSSKTKVKANAKKEPEKPKAGSSGNEKSRKDVNSKKEKTEKPKTARKRKSAEYTLDFADGDGYCR